MSINLLKCDKFLIHLTKIARSLVKLIINNIKT